MVKNKYIRLLAMSLVIIIALSFIQDFADFLDENSEKVVRLGVNQQCNPLTSICSASIINEGEFQRISFAINGATLSASGALIEFPMTLTATGFDFEGIQSVSVSFERPDEDLDSTIILFSPDKSAHQVVPENWTATAKLPAAPDNRTDWLAVIRLKSSKKEYLAEFPFHSKKAGGY